MMYSVIAKEHLQLCQIQGILTKLHTFDPITFIYNFKIFTNICELSIN